MACNTVAKEIISAMVKEVLNGSDAFSIVSNGTLYSVTFNNIITQLGVTGSLASAASTSAIPILGGTAPAYTVRGIKASQGVSAQLSPEGDVEIKASFKNAGGTANGAPLIVSATSNPIAIRRMKAGNGISISQNSNYITISNTEIAVANNTITISVLADFPSPIGGVITLQDNKDYLLVANISTSSRFILGTNTVIRAVDPRITGFVYTGTGYMFTLPNGNQTFKQISMSTPNGTLLTSAGNTSGTLSMREVLLPSVKNLGILEKPTVQIDAASITSLTGQGFLFGGALRRLSLSNLTVGNVTSATSILLDIDGATFAAFNIQSVDILASAAGSKFLKGLAAGANMNADVIGNVANINIQGDMVALDTIAYTDFAWDFEQSNSIPTTSHNALTALSSAQTRTVATQGVFSVFSGSAAFVQVNAHGFVTNVNGRITHVAKRTALRDLNATISLAPTSLNDRIIKAAIFKNGALIAASTVTSTISNGLPKSMVLIWSDVMNTDDFYEIGLTNASDNTSILVTNCIFRAD